MRAALQAGVIGAMGVLSLVAWCAKAPAEEPPATVVLTLAEAVRLALSHQPTLLAARGTTEAQQALVGVELVSPSECRRRVQALDPKYLPCGERQFISERHPVIATIDL